MPRRRAGEVMTERAELKAQAALRTEERKTDPPSVRQVGTLCQMAFDLAAKSAGELALTGQVTDRRVARTRMLLAKGAADEFLSLLRKRTTPGTGSHGER